MGVLTVWSQWDGCVNSVGSMGWVLTVEVNGMGVISVRSMGWLYCQCGVSGMGVLTVEVNGMGVLTVWGQWDGCVNREVNGMGVLSV